jgi:hypothetical protein
LWDIIFFAFITFVGITVSSIQSANAASLKVTQTVVVPIDLDPMHIRIGTDGNYVVTGTRHDFKQPQRAGAIGLSPSGKVLWQYSSPVFDPQISPPSPQSYANSVEMADGSIFLCGLVFKAPQIGAPRRGVLLSHLGQNGMLLGEQVIPLTDRHVQSSGKCAKWGDGLVVYGDYGEHVDAAPAATAHLWKLDKDGKLNWEKDFDQGGRGIVSGDYLYTLSESYSGTPKDVRIPASGFGDINIHRISLSGEEEEIQRIPGFLGRGGLIANAAFPEKNEYIYMLGTTEPAIYTDNLTRRVLVKFDSNLHELRRFTTDTSPPIASVGIISQPDGSLFHYGMIGKGVLKNYPAMGAAYSNADFTQQATVNLEVGEFDEYPKLNVAASAGVMDHFVAASRLFLKDFYNNRGEVNPVVEKKFPPSTTPGHYLVAQFIQVTR